ncbi:unnamed protein product [Arctia plantaginis]|uniref:Uncharacterized protein n=1 Tax=Arctia plantaginis TaxID=874455 RepID=A0A8S1B3A0_ARCPL|nr:unnamed protein product [Arctia plantaginis]
MFSPQSKDHGELFDFELIGAVDDVQGRQTVDGPTSKIVKDHQVSSTPTDPNSSPVDLRHLSKVLSCRPPYYPGPGLIAHLSQPFENPFPQPWSSLYFFQFNDAVDTNYSGELLMFRPGRPTAGPHQLTMSTTAKAVYVSADVNQDSDRRILRRMRKEREIFSSVPTQDMNMDEPSTPAKGLFPDQPNPFTPFCGWLFDPQKQLPLWAFLPNQGEDLKWGVSPNLEKKGGKKIEDVSGTETPPKFT